jgi:hypothetical protein
MQVAHKAGAPYDYITPQRILLMRLPLGDTAYCWFMEVVPPCSYLLFVGAPYAP